MCIRGWGREREGEKGVGRRRLRRGLFYIKEREEKGKGRGGRTGGRSCSRGRADKGLGWRNAARMACSTVILCWTTRRVRSTWYLACWRLGQTVPLYTVRPSRDGKGSGCGKETGGHSAGQGSEARS